MDDALNFGHREEWRSWLAENFDKQKYAWLLLCKKGVDMKRMSLEEAVEEAICFGWIDGKLRRVDEKRFILRFSPRKLKSIWSKINKERAERLIATGRLTEAGLATVDAAKKSVPGKAPTRAELQDPCLKILMKL